MGQLAVGSMHFPRSNMIPIPQQDKPKIRADGETTLCPPLCFPAFKRSLNFEGRPQKTLITSAVTGHFEQLPKKLSNPAAQHKLNLRHQAGLQQQHRRSTDALSIKYEDWTYHLEVKLFNELSMQNREREDELQYLVFIVKK